MSSPLAVRATGDQASPLAHQLETSKSQRVEMSSHRLSISVWNAERWSTRDVETRNRSTRLASFGMPRVASQGDFCSSKGTDDFGVNYTRLEESSFQHRTTSCNSCFNKSRDPCCCMLEPPNKTPGLCYKEDPRCMQCAFCARSKIKPSKLTRHNSRHIQRNYCPLRALLKSGLGPSSPAPRPRFRSLTLLS